MSMSLRLSDAAVRGSVYSPSDDALRALQSGDTQALIDSHRDRFGGWKMEDDPEEDEDEDDDSEDGDDDEDPDDDEDADEDEEDGPEGKKSKAKKKAVEGDPQAKIKALEDEKNRLYRGRAQARKERDDARAEIERIKKDGTTDDTLKSELSEVKSKNVTLSTQLQDALLRIAFLSDNTYEWQNPGVALKAADLSKIEIDDDGSVHGMREALEALATDNAYLLKTTKRTATAPKAGTTGQRPGKRPAKKSAAAQRAEIVSKYKINR
jgi:hypothetical protein